MGSGTPLLNEYKQEFLWKRLPQTILGGLRLKLGFCAPLYIYLCQVLLFLTPWIVGGVFTLIVEEDVLAYDIAIYVYGSIMCLFVLALNVVGATVREKCSAVSSVALNAHNVLSEENEMDFVSCCSIETINFLLPAKRFLISVLVHALLSGPFLGLGFWYLLPSTLNNVYDNNLSATVSLYGFGWICLCIAQYSLTVAPPTESAIFRTSDRWELGPLMRPFYCMIFFSFDLLAR